MPWLGAHSFDVTKLRPASRNAGHACPIVVTANLSDQRQDADPTGVTVAAWGAVDEHSLGPWAARIERS